LQEGMIGYRYLGGEVAGHLNDLNSRGSETIRLPTESITREIKMKISTKARCVECSRVFDLLDTNDANEWAYGHDCEA
jgi:hypothetical protein